MTAAVDLPRDSGDMSLLKRLERGPDYLRNDATQPDNSSVAVAERRGPGERRDVRPPWVRRLQPGNRNAVVANLRPDRD